MADNAVRLRRPALGCKLRRGEAGCASRPSFFSPGERLRLLGLLLLLPLARLGPVVGAEALPEIRSAAAIRRLTPEEADRHYPVRLEGVLTFMDQRTRNIAFRFVQDDSAGIYFTLEPAAVLPALATGQRVEILGQTDKGEFAPVVMAREIRVLGPGTFPAAKPVSFDQLLSGQEDSQFVEVQGMARAVQPEMPPGFYSIEITVGGGRVTAFAAELPVEHGDDLVGASVKVRGVCATQFNLRRQLFDVRLLVPRREDLVVEQPAPRTDPFAGPAQTIGTLLQFRPEGNHGHRVKVSGQVVCRPTDQALYIQDATEGLYAETHQAGKLQPGDLVEVVGFPAKGEYTPMLQDAIFRQIGTGPPPRPDEVTTDEALKGTHDCRLVRIDATVLDRSRSGGEDFLVLQTGGFIFQAHLPRPGAGALFANLQNGSEIAATGVCVIEKGSDWFAGQGWRAKSFRLLLRSPEDIVVLKRPPWWTLARLLWASGLLATVTLVAVGWIAVLRRRVGQQTRIISEKLQAEAALKERYVDLFENANDMVYTHDLKGRLTSINQAGQRLLQQTREEILAHNIVDLVVPEQRAAAQQWLEQVLKDTAPETAEWDFSVAGQAVKLEISTRLIAQNGQQAEVEGIARDVTTRKRLERELLDISTREQRRIGHDLHDGVCQQLVGIAYLTETLADRLQEHGAVEAAEAERITQLLNHTLTQTRGVARGLFPVRLEENGLVSALEELAGQTSNLFQVACRFVCETPPGRVDNDRALHLYYIAQEAIVNAAKHGKAKDVQIKLEPFQDRYALTVQDDGIGFRSAAPSGTGMGLRIMDYRARVIGATLELKSQPGRGTTVQCVFLPVAHELAAK